MMRHLAVITDARGVCWVSTAIDSFPRYRAVKSVRYRLSEEDLWIKYH